MVHFAHAQHWQGIRSNRGISIPPVGVCFRVQADAIVINTCGFVEDAKNESIEVRPCLLPRSLPLLAAAAAAVAAAAAAAAAATAATATAAAGLLLPRLALLLAYAAACRPHYSKSTYGSKQATGDATAAFTPITPALACTHLHSPAPTCAPLRSPSRPADHYRRGAPEGGGAGEEGGGDGVPGAAVLGGAGGAAARGRPGGGESPDAALPGAAGAGCFLLGWGKAAPSVGCTEQR